MQGTDDHAGLREALQQARQCAFMGPPAEGLTRRACMLAEQAGNEEALVEAQILALFSNLYFLPAPSVQASIDALQAKLATMQSPDLAHLLTNARAHLALSGFDAEQALRLTQGLEDLPADQLHPLGRDIALYHLTLSHYWLGQQNDALRFGHRWHASACSGRQPHMQVMAKCMLGILYSTCNFEHRTAADLLHDALQIDRALPLNRWSGNVVARMLEALMGLDRHADALAMLNRELLRPGMSKALDMRHATVASVYLANDDLANAELWLGQMSPDRPGQPFLQWQWRLVKVQLLLAQQRHAEAMELAQSELARQADVVRPAAELLRMYQSLNLACQALGLDEQADAAAARASESLLSAVGAAAQSKYLTIQLTGNAASAPPSPQALRRLDVIERVVKTELAKPKVPRFLAHVSHEMRNPIQGMMGLSDLLRMSDLDARQRRFVDAMKSSAQMLMHLVNDVMDLARMESGHFELQLAPLQWPELLEATCLPFREASAARGVVLQWESGTVGDAPWQGDALRLRQVLNNLVSNALKFTRQGSIELRLRVLPHCVDRPRWVRCEVRDTGKGIAPEAQQRLFNEFVQEDASIARQYGGTGLGLALCKSLVQHMGGRIGLQSQVGVGSTFWFEVPEGVVSRAEAQDDEPPGCCCA